MAILETSSKEKIIENKRILVNIYKNCILSKKSFVDCNKIDLHHLYSQHTIRRNFYNHNKMSDFKVGMGCFIHSILNLIPLDHDSHIAGVGKLNYSIKEYKKMIEYLTINNHLYDSLNFNTEIQNCVDIAYKVFDDSLGYIPYWFVK